MRTNTKTNETSKLDQIVANARQNRREANKFSLKAVTREEEDHLKSQSISAAQISLLERLGVACDQRPLPEGGTCSRWNAMNIIDETLRDLRERREKARALPASEKQVLALLKFGCSEDDMQGLTSGEASDLIRRLAHEASAQNKARTVIPS